MKLSALTILLFAIMATTDKSSYPKAAEPLLHYLVREPKVKSAHPPVIFLLHGIGSNEQDLFSFADHLPGKFLVISARAPIVLGTNSFAWYQADFSKEPPVINKEQEEESRGLIVRFIGQMKEQYHFDEKQVYLAGFSQGAIMSYTIMLTRPGIVKGVAIMSGRILDEIKPLVASRDKLSHLSAFISHGTNDNVINIRHARAAKAYLEQLGIHPAYKEYPEAHGINNDNFADLVSWLSKQ
jgi:phospholipase/carboxylesterase